MKLSMHADDEAVVFLYEITAQHFGRWVWNRECTRWEVLRGVAWSADTQSYYLLTDKGSMNMGKDLRAQVKFYDKNIVLRVTNPNEEKVILDRLANLLEDRE